MDISRTYSSAGTKINDHAGQDQLLLQLCRALGLLPETSLCAIAAAYTRYPSIGALVDAVLNGCVQITGVDSASRQRLAAALTMADGLAAERLVYQGRIAGPEACLDWLRVHIGAASHEYFCAVFLDAGHGVLAVEDLFRGTIDGAVVYPRVVVESALGWGAAAAIVAHNHPSGRCEPSSADLQITQRLKQALALVDIDLLDHLIVSRDDWVSLAERGDL